MDSIDHVLVSFCYELSKGVVPRIAYQAKRCVSLMKIKSKAKKEKKNPFQNGTGYRRALGVPRLCETNWLSARKTGTVLSNTYSMVFIDEK